MIPLQPVSVKFTDEERARLKALAYSLGWTESQIVRDSVAHILHLIHNPDSQDEPKLITLARLALAMKKIPCFSKSTSERSTNGPLLLTPSKTVR